MKTDNRKKATKLLEQTIDKLISINVILTEENDKGNQWDYVNDPRLSNLVDHVKRISDRINRIVYQSNS